MRQIRKRSEPGFWRDFRKEKGAVYGITWMPKQELREALAREQGYEADNLVCAGDLPEGRPTPMNMYQCFLDLGVWPAHAVVKVDDTGVGIDEGVRAGCWTIGVALSGNEAGLTVDEVRRLSGDADEQLTAVFLKLTGGSGLQEIDEVL